MAVPSASADRPLVMTIDLTGPDDIHQLFYHLRAYRGQILIQKMLNSSFCMVTPLKNNFHSATNSRQLVVFKIQIR